MRSISLKEFTVSVPTCSPNASLTEVLALLQQTKSDRLVIINGHGSPLHIIYLRNLIPYWSLDCGDRTLVEQPVSQVATSALEPLNTLAASWTVSQTQIYLHDEIVRDWAVVDEAGKFLGLFDATRFWRSLVPDFSETVPASRATSEPAPGFNHLLHFASVAPLSLITLLEQLPFPLMVQTNTGRVVTQNKAWRQGVGELLDPVGILQEAAQFLEATHSATAGSSFLNEAVPRSDYSGHAEFQSGHTLSPDDALSSRFCRIGKEPNSCICVCPTKDGQERSWQFIKIPLGTIPSETELVSDEGYLTAAVSTQAREADSSLQFRLATLSSPDPFWSYSNTASYLTASESLWLVLAQDTTEQQQTVKELAAKNADLAQLNRLKDEFLACISHELKTPLTAILGLSNLLKDQQIGQLNSKQVRYAELIYQSGRHLVLIVNDILDLTRIETNQLELSPSQVDIQMICDRAYEQACQLLPMANHNSPRPEVQFHIEVEPGLETITADEMRLRQMLANLLSNALKFTDDGGAIALTVNTWEGWLAFTVSDTGIGIPTAQQHLIFQKFQQLENPLTRRFEGTGLGLVLTQKLARLHGGDVTFTSIEGKGSQFTLLLPPSPPCAARSSGVSQPPPAYSHRLVLVVEADPDLLGSLTAQLMHLGYRVAIARSGTEALEKIRRLQPRAVFLNPLLPLLSGWDVLTLLKADPDLRHIPVMVMASALEKAQAQRNGADGFLTLPIQAEALERSLKHWISNPTLPSPSAVKITVLYLHAHEGQPTDRSVVQLGQVSALSEQERFSAALNNLLHSHHCRVLEVDDLDQADLLARVWKPDVILLDGAIEEPFDYLSRLAQQSFLSTLPLVTLTPEMTQAANQVDGLMVFPCLDPLATVMGNSSTQDELSSLLQVIQVAAGLDWVPSILLVDALMLDRPSAAGHDRSKSIDWLRVADQYLQTAGFRSAIGRSWNDVLQQINHQTIDVLLLVLRHPAHHSAWAEALQTLAAINSKPPILVWDWQPDDTQTSLHPLIRAIATEILPASLPMPDLLQHIHQALIRR